MPLRDHYCMQATPARIPPRREMIQSVEALINECAISAVGVLSVLQSRPKQKSRHARLERRLQVLCPIRSMRCRITRTIRQRSKNSCGLGTTTHECSRRSWGTSRTCPTATARMLDRSLILYGSNMSNSQAHDHFPLPLVVVGGGCGKLRGGRHLRYPDCTPHSNLLVTMLHRAGVPVESIGDRTGECAEV
jgi:hypothetical protein